jgi:hypothetical protein
VLYYWLFGAVVRIAALALIAIISFSTVFVGEMGITVGEIRAQPQNVESLSSENLFDVDLLYAYVQPGASSAVAVLNFTRVSNITLPADSGITEVYTIEVFSEGKLVRTTGRIGCEIGRGIDMDVLMDLAMGGTFGAYGFVGLMTLSVEYSPVLYPALIAPISVSLIRLGWITVDRNGTDINLSSHETVKHVELAKYQAGFLYNTLLPQDQLSQIDLFSPLKSFNAISPTPSPDLTEKPTISPQPTPAFPTALIVAFIVSASVAIAGLLVYFKKRKSASLPIYNERKG